MPQAVAWTGDSDSASYQITFYLLLMVSN